jgi:hypothetical protein
MIGAPTGTRFFLLGAITKERPFKELTELKYDLAETSVELEYFHVSEKAQPAVASEFDILAGPPTP